MLAAPVLNLRRLVRSLGQVKVRTWYELVLLPAILAITGYAILRWVDGIWWGIMLWMLVAPVLYLGIDFVFFSAEPKTAATNANRKRTVVSGRSGPGSTSPRPVVAASPPEWRGAQDVSSGSEILRRGRRYDHRA